MNTATSTKKNMNFDTIAFSKGFLRVRNYVVDDITDAEYFGLEPTMSQMIVNMQMELMRYGYMLDAKCLRQLAQMTEDEVEKVANSVVDYLADAYGDGTFVTLFGNYPQTVLKMSEFEMFVHQIFHYLSGGSYSPAMPSCDDMELDMLHSQYDDRVLKDSYKLITPISDCDLAEYFKKILSAQQSLTSYDKDVVVYLCEHYNELGVGFWDCFPEEIPFKETLCLVLANTEEYMPKTVTDVLRYAVYLSGGDVALPALPNMLDYGWNPASFARCDKSLRDRYEQYYKDRVNAARKAYNFAKFSRGQRRDILEMMEYVLEHNRWDNVLADMKKYMGRWIRLGERLHPGEYAKKYPKTNEAFVMLRNSGQYIATYGGKVQALRDAGDVTNLVALYSTRPGEFARNIDNLLRNYPDSTGEVLLAFAKVLPEVSIKMLYELLDHFNVRNDVVGLTDRYVTVKGSREPYKLEDLKKMDENTLADLMSTLTLELYDRFQAKGSLDGETYIIDKRLEDIALPKNMRSMNIAPGQLARGSKLKFETSTGLIRCYCRWVDKFGMYDLDLATQMYDENFKFKTSISWNTYYKQGDWAVFSGDVRHRRGNCAEYIDIDINKALANGVRYVVATVNDFDGGGFTKKDAWGGIMERSQMGTPGEKTWAPDTIATGFRLTSACTNIVMTVIDLEEKVMYVVDEDVAGIPVASTSRDRLGSVAKRYVTEKRFFNALGLISSNISARKGVTLFIDHEKIEDKKAEIEENKKKYADLITQYKTAFETATEAEKAVIESTLPAIESMYETLCNTKFITYDDIASDYTKLFEWMF